MWLNRHKLNNSLVVFLHGLFGSRWGTWQFLPDALQLACTENPLVRSYDYYLFEYDSTKRRQPEFDPIVLAHLDDFLTRIAPKYETMVLIGHSQGGILAKLYLLKKLEEGKGLELKVDCVITISTPHRGSVPANLLLGFQQVPVLGERMPLRQMAQLATRSVSIRKLKEKWGPPLICPDPCAPAPSSRYVRSLAGVGSYDGVVLRRSSSGFPPVDVSMYIGSPHSISKAPSRESGRLVEYLTEALERNRPPEDVLAEIKRIRQRRGLLDDFFRDHAAQVASIVAAKRPEMKGSGGIEIKAAGLLWDFLYDFPERPLRGLDLRRALAMYATRQFEREV